MERGPSIGHTEPVALVAGPRVTAFRGWSLVLLIAISVAAGFGLHEVWDLAVGAWKRAAQPSVRVTAVRGIEGALVLEGPGGPVTLPQRAPVVVHVWLEGCADCMDAFRAHKRLHHEQLFSGVRVVNVAYGRATENFAREYGVDSQLAFDPGDQLVRPLGISTFTTLVVDTEGRIRFRSRPTEPGYADRLRGALDALARGP
ncbi:MAG: TlpA family protein disulfide reductase [Myxococcota bacterium]